MHRIFFVLVIMLVLVAGCGRVVDTGDTDLAAVNLPSGTEQLGTFSTKFTPGDDDGRDTNIKLASEAINQTVVQPGEVFSFNNTVGPTTEKNGYKEAMIYVNGQKDKGYGGGVCQVSSTLHNAAENAGMTVKERHDHSLPVTYVEAGKEAATSYGVLDYKFINELSFPVVIESHVADGEITVTISNV